MDAQMGELDITPHRPLDRNKRGEPPLPAFLEKGGCGVVVARESNAEARAFFQCKVATLVIIPRTPRAKIQRHDTL